MELDIGFYVLYMHLALCKVGTITLFAMDAAMLVMWNHHFMNGCVSLSLYIFIYIYI